MLWELELHFFATSTVRICRIRPALKVQILETSLCGVRRWGGGPSGPNLPRERVTEEPVKGEVLEWKARAISCAPCRPSP